MADAVCWIKTTDGLWGDPLNWSNGAVSGTNDNVIIDMLSANVTVTHASGTVLINNLLLNERLELNGTVANTGVLQVSEGIQFGGTIAFGGGTVLGGMVTQQAGGKRFFAQHNGNALAGVSVQGDLDLASGGRVLIRNGLTLAEKVLLDNTGSIVIAGNSGFLSVEGNSTLTLGLAIVVRGRTASSGSRYSRAAPTRSSTKA